MKNKSMDLRARAMEGGTMFFSAYCAEAGTEVLLGPDNVVDLSHGPFGFELHYRCHCGQAGVLYPQLGRDAGPRCA
jgi:hypothetical protein